jgi:hypothetical protein
MSEIERVKRKYEPFLLQLRNVVGVSVGPKIIQGVQTTQPCIKVYVKRKVNEATLWPDQVIPKKLDGYPTDVEEIGSPRFLPQAPQVEAVSARAISSSQLLRLLRLYEAILLAIRNVVGIGIGNKDSSGQPAGQRCVKVYVDKKYPRRQLLDNDLIPQKLSDPKVLGEQAVETDVEEVGQLVPTGYVVRRRPAPGGASIGHHAGTAGTLGCLVRDAQTGALLLLSSNHVLANGDALGSSRAKQGDAIVQPAIADGGSLPGDILAELERWIPIDFSNKGNLVDAAVAKPRNEQDVVGEIAELGLPLGVVGPRLGMQVEKMGRTTGKTQGRIIDAHATIRIFHGSRVALFRDQILTTPMAETGDSGAILLTTGKYACGLLCAGSRQVNCYNHLSAVLRSLKVELYTPGGQ